MAFIDLCGKRVGSLLVTSLGERTTSNKVTWNVRCDCGREISNVHSTRLRKDPRHICVCSPRPVVKRKSPKVLNDDRYTALVGRTFGNLLVSGIAGRDKHGRMLMTVVCSCGNEINILTTVMTTGKKTCCGCTFTRKRPNFTDLTGRRFGRLTVVRLSEFRVGKKGTLAWVCMCDCGKTWDVVTNHLTSGHTRSCGCFHLARARDANKGHARNKFSDEQIQNRIASLPVVVNKYGGRIAGDSSVTCKVCGHTWVASVRNLSSGRSCPVCAGWGFDPSKEGVLYVLRVVSRHDEYIGFGITRELDKRMTYHNRNATRAGATIEPLATYTMSGYAALAVEKTLKQTLDTVDTGVEGFRTEAVRYANHVLDTIAAEAKKYDAVFEPLFSRATNEVSIPCHFHTNSVM